MQPAKAYDLIINSGIVTEKVTLKPLFPTKSLVSLITCMYLRHCCISHPRISNINILHHIKSLCTHQDCQEIWSSRGLCSFLIQVQAMISRKGTFSSLPPFSLCPSLDLKLCRAASEHPVVVLKYRLFIPSWFSHSVPTGARCPSQAGVEVGAGLLLWMQWEACYPQYSVLDNMVRTLILRSIKGPKVWTGNVHIQTFTLDSWLHWFL